MTTTQTLPPPGEFRTTQEIRDANFAGRLRRRRRLMFWWSLPLVVIALLAAVKLISAVIINTAGISAYGNENHHTAANRFGHLEVVNVVEPWKPYFNAGTATYATGDFFEATVPLQEALDRVPKTPEQEPRGAAECDVRTNYSLSLEGLGDEAMTAENPGTALDYYEQAQEMLADCADPEGEGGDEAQEADERQQESQEQAQEQHDEQQQESGAEGHEGSEDEEQNRQEDEQDNGEGTEDDGEEQEDQNGQEDERDQNGDGQDEERDPREEELEERNQQAQEERERQEQQDGGGDGSGQNW